MTSPGAKRICSGESTFKHVSPPKRASALRMFSPVDNDDLEVETVLGYGGRRAVGALNAFMRSHSSDHFEIISKTVPSPYRPSTVMTNLSRGNVQTTTPSSYASLTMQQLAAQGEIILLQQELQDGVHLNAVDEDGFAALHWACANGQVDTARFLTGKGADVSVEGNQGETALLLAACFGFVDIVRLLLSMAAEVNHVDVGGNTALMYAAYNNHAACAAALLEYGCDLTLANEDHLTAFDLAVAQSSKQAQHSIERHVLNLLEGARV